MFRVCCAGLISLPLLVLTASVRAQPDQPPDDSTALALFNEATILMEQAHYELACPKLEESYRLQSAIDTLSHLSDCYRHIGRTASAWAGFQRVAAMARAAGQSEQADLATAEATALEPHLSRLRIVVSSKAAVLGLTVRVDGTDVGRGDWGKNLPVDPGTHHVSVFAPGKVPWSTDLVLEHPGEIVSLELPILETRGAIVSSANASGERAPTLGALGRSNAGLRNGLLVSGQAPSPGWGKSTALLATGTVASVAAVGAGIGLTLAAGGKTDEVKELRAPDTAQTQQGTYQNAAIGAFVTGGIVGVMTAGYAILPASRSKEGREVRVRPSINTSVTEGGIQVSGKF